MSTNTVTLPWIQEIAEINRKYNFRAEGRSPEDVTRVRELRDQIQAFDKDYDEKNPVEPCPGCASTRKASLWGGLCLNFGVCPLAPIAAGG